MRKTVIAAALMAAAPVFAQTAAPSQFYIGIDGASQKLKFGGDLAGGPSSPSVFKDTKTTPRLFGGYQISPNWAFEVGYSSTKYGITVDDDDERVNGAFRFKGFDLGVTYKLTEGLPGLFVKAGIGRFKGEATGTEFTKATGVTTSVYDSQSGTSPMFGFGYETNITGNLDGHIGYTQYNKVAGFSDLKIRLYYAGLKYRF